MTSFEPGILDAQPLSQNLLQTVRLIGEYKGKQALFRQRSPQVLETLQEVAIIQSAESSNRIEGIVTAPQRLRQLMRRQILPSSRSEQEIAGYRDVLNTIHASYPHIPFSVNLVRQMHRDLMQFSPATGGNWKLADNTITQRLTDGTEVVRFQPTPAFQTPQAMAHLHQRFDHYWQTQTIEPLLLIATYALDFLCIHPFNDGNGRLARLLTLLLLYQAGYEVGRYISLESLIEQSRESYYDTLYWSSQGWHEGQHSLMPWWEYFLGLILKAYRDFEQRVGLVAQSPGRKRQQVVAAVARLTQQFQIADLERACPGVSRPTLNRALAQLRDEGKIVCIKAGRDALWQKVEEPE